MAVTVKLAPQATLLLGDVREAAAQLPRKYFHCMATSPPYYGLRNYKNKPSVWGGDPACVHEWGDQTGTAKDIPSRFCSKCSAWLGCLGNEPTVSMYVSHLVEIFALLRGSLRDDATFWLNLGDSYNGTGGATTTFSFGRPVTRGEGNKSTQIRRDPEVKVRELCLIPERVLLALQADGWYVRAKPPWVKMNAMPEPHISRPVQGHEAIFLLSLKPTYFYDGAGVRIPALQTAKEQRRGIDTSRGIMQPLGRNRKTSDWFLDSMDAMIDYHLQAAEYMATLRDTGGLLSGEDWNPYGFLANTSQNRATHLAVWPAGLVNPMIRASTSSRCCHVCGTPWERVIVQGPSEWDQRRHTVKTRTYEMTSAAEAGFSRLAKSQRLGATLGFRPTCNHYNSLYHAELDRTQNMTRKQKQDTDQSWLKRAKQRPGFQTWPAVPCRVLDPFAGSGTTLAAAVRMGREAWGIEINPTFVPAIKQQVREAIPD